MDTSATHVMGQLSAANNMIIGSLRTLAAFPYALFAKNLLYVVEWGLCAILALVIYTAVRWRRGGEESKDTSAWDYSEEVEWVMIPVWELTKKIVTKTKTTVETKTIKWYPSGCQISTVTTVETHQATLANDPHDNVDDDGPAEATHRVGDPKRRAVLRAFKGEEQHDKRADAPHAQATAEGAKVPTWRVQTAGRDDVSDIDSGDEGYGSDDLKPTEQTDIYDDPMWDISNYVDESLGPIHPHSIGEFGDHDDAPNPEYSSSDANHRGGQPVDERITDVSGLDDTEVAAWIARTGSPDGVLESGEDNADPESTPEDFDEALTIEDILSLGRAQPIRFDPDSDDDDSSTHSSAPVDDDQLEGLEETITPSSDGHAADEALVEVTRDVAETYIPAGMKAANSAFHESSSRAADLESTQHAKPAQADDGTKIETMETTSVHDAPNTHTDGLHADEMHYDASDGVIKSGAGAELDDGDIDVIEPTVKVTDKPDTRSAVDEPWEVPSEHEVDSSLLGGLREPMTLAETDAEEKTNVAPHVYESIIDRDGTFAAAVNGSADTSSSECVPANANIIGTGHGAAEMLDDSRSTAVDAANANDAVPSQKTESLEVSQVLSNNHGNAINVDESAVAETLDDSRSTAVEAANVNDAVPSKKTEPLEVSKVLSNNDGKKVINVDKSAGALIETGHGAAETLDDSRTTAADVANANDTVPSRKTELEVGQVLSNIDGNAVNVDESAVAETLDDSRSAAVETANANDAVPSQKARPLEVSQALSNNHGNAISVTDSAVAVIETGNGAAETSDDSRSAIIETAHTHDTVPSQETQPLEVGQVLSNNNGKAIIVNDSAVAIIEAGNDAAETLDHNCSMAVETANGNDSVPSQKGQPLEVSQVLSNNHGKANDDAESTLAVVGEAQKPGKDDEQLLRKAGDKFHAKSSEAKITREAAVPNIVVSPPDNVAEAVPKPKQVSKDLLSPGPRRERKNRHQRKRERTKKIEPQWLERDAAPNVADDSDSEDKGEIGRRRMMDRLHLAEPTGKEESAVPELETMLAALSLRKNTNVTTPMHPAKQSQQQKPEPSQSEPLLQQPVEAKVPHLAAIPQHSEPSAAQAPGQQNTEVAVTPQLAAESQPQQQMLLHDPPHPVQLPKQHAETPVLQTPEPLMDAITPAQPIDPQQPSQQHEHQPPVSEASTDVGSTSAQFDPDLALIDEVNRMIEEQERELARDREVFEQSQRELGAAAGAATYDEAELPRQQQETERSELEAPLAQQQCLPQPTQPASGASPNVDNTIAQSDPDSDLITDVNRLLGEQERELHEQLLRDLGPAATEQDEVAWQQQFLQQQFQLHQQQQQQPAPQDTSMVDAYFAENGYYPDERHQHQQQGWQLQQQQPPQPENGVPYTQSQQSSTFAAGVAGPHLGSFTPQQPHHILEHQQQQQNEAWASAPETEMLDVDNADVMPDMDQPPQQLQQYVTPLHEPVQESGVSSNLQLHPPSSLPGQQLQQPSQQTHGFDLAAPQPTPVPSTASHGGEQLNAGHLPGYGPQLTIAPGTDAASQTYGVTDTQRDRIEGVRARMRTARRELWAEKEQLRDIYVGGTSSSSAAATAPAPAPAVTAPAVAAAGSTAAVAATTTPSAVPASGAAGSQTLDVTDTQRNEIEEARARMRNEKREQWVDREQLQDAYVGRTALSSSADAKSSGAATTSTSPASGAGVAGVAKGKEPMGNTLETSALAVFKHPVAFKHPTLPQRKPIDAAGEIAAWEKKWNHKFSDSSSSEDDDDDDDDDDESEEEDGEGEGESYEDDGEDDDDEAEVEYEDDSEVEEEDEVEEEVEEEDEVEDEDEDEDMDGEGYDEDDEDDDDDDEDSDDDDETEVEDDDEDESDADLDAKIAALKAQLARFELAEQQMRASMEAKKRAT